MNIKNSCLYIHFWNFLAKAAVYGQVYLYMYIFLWNALEQIQRDYTGTVQYSLIQWYGCVLIDWLIDNLASQQLA